MRAKNRITGEVRSVSDLTLEDMEALTYDEIEPWCSGPCECHIEPDGVCPDGWPSVMLVAGLL